MYIDTWETFYEQAEELYRANPLRTRYVLKYRHCDGKLVAKVTDDHVCLQYKTDKQADVKKLEKLNALFFSLMATGEAPAADAAADATNPQIAKQSNKNRRKG